MRAVKARAKATRRRAVRLRVNPRVFYELGTVYQEPLEALRELIQNAIDAGATRIEIEVRDGELIFRHDGAPIEGESLDAFLEVGTSFKAGRKGMIGQYGIGRLSWVMLGDEAAIWTGNKVLRWRADDLSKIEVEEAPERLEGVEWRIKLKPELSDVGARNIARYLKDVYYGEVPIVVRDAFEAIPVERGAENWELLFEDRHNKVYLTYEPDPGKIVKGPFLADTDYNLNGLVVYTTDPRVKLNPARHVVRDTEYLEWRSEVARRALKALAEKVSPDVAWRISSMVKEWMEEAVSAPTPFGFTKPSEELIAKYFKYWPMRTYEGDYYYLKDLLKVVPKSKVVVSDALLSDSLWRALKERGYTVIVEQYPSMIRFYEALGIKKVSDVEEKLKLAEARALQEASLVAEDVLKEVEEILREVKPRARPKPRPSYSIKAEVSREEAQALAEAAREGKVKVAELGDTRTVAAVVGGAIVLNARNPLMKEVAKEFKEVKDAVRRKLMLAPIVIHERLHQLGLDHTDPEFQWLYETLLTRYIMTLVKQL